MTTTQRQRPPLKVLRERAAYLRAERQALAEIRELEAGVIAESYQPRQRAICPLDGCLLAYSGENCPACQVRLLGRPRPAREAA